MDYVILLKKRGVKDFLFSFQGGVGLLMECAKKKKSGPKFFFSILSKGQHFIFI